MRKENYTLRETTGRGRGGGGGETDLRKQPHT